MRCGLKAGLDCLKLAKCKVNEKFCRSLLVDKSEYHLVYPVPHNSAQKVQIDSAPATLICCLIKYTLLSKYIRILRCR